MTRQPDHTRLHAAMTRLLGPYGFDIVHGFPVQLFNSQGCPSEHQLPTFDRSSTLGIIIGNTNVLWTKFLEHLAMESCTLNLQDNPLDCYVEAAVTKAVQQCCSAQVSMPAHPSAADIAAVQRDKHTSQTSASRACPSRSCDTEARGSRLRSAIRFSHDFEPGKFVNMMRAAQLSGLAYYSTTTHLCVHPVYGPWFALRAVVIFDADGPDPQAFSQLSCPHPDIEDAAAQKMQELEAKGGFSEWQQHWQDWAALRGLGAKHTDPRYTYSADQLEYHYTKNKEVLRRAVAAWRQQQQAPLVQQQQQHEQEEHQDNQQQEQRQQQ